MVLGSRRSRDHIVRAREHRRSDRSAFLSVYKGNFCLLERCLNWQIHFCIAKKYLLHWAILSNLAAYVKRTMAAAATCHTNNTPEARVENNRTAGIWRGYGGSRRGLGGMETIENPCQTPPEPFKSHKTLYLQDSFKSHKTLFFFFIYNSPQDFSTLYLDWTF